jgi:hypothetical protein
MVEGATVDVSGDDVRGSRLAAAVQISRAVRRAVAGDGGGSASAYFFCTQWGARSETCRGASKPKKVA